MKKFITGFLAGSLLFGGIGAFAAGGKLIEVFYNVKDIKINKVSQMPSDEKPFIYNGKTYVPLRYISEKLGQPVKWAASTQTIHIGHTDEETAVYPGNGINHLNYQEGTRHHSFQYAFDNNTVFEWSKEDKYSKIKDNVGNEYARYVAMYLDNWSDYWNFLEFPLNGQYKTFKAKLGLTDEYKSSSDNVTVKIYADDVEILKKDLTGGSIPEDISVDISNAVKIKIEVTKDGSQNNTQVGLFDARFIK